MKAEMKSRVDAPILGAKGNVIQIIIAPTGYGKTSSIHYSWGLLSERWGRVVHVLPMRAIVSDVTGRAVERGVPPDDVTDRIAIEDIAFPRYVVAPFDVFSFSLYVAPVAKLGRVHEYRDVGLLSAAGGGVFFDEPHLTLATDEADAAAEGRKVFTVLSHEILVLSRYLRRPVVLATSTLPAEQLSELVARLNNVEAKIHLYLGERGQTYYKGGGIPVEAHGLDPDFSAFYESYMKGVKTRVSRNGVEAEAVWALNRVDRVAVFCNTVARAVEVYENLKDSTDAELILLHNRFIEKDLRERVERARQLLARGGRVVVVSTQVLEAGTDFDFDAAVTEVAAPGALIQRAGRVFRHLDRRGEDERAYVIIDVSEKSLRSASAVYGDAARVAEYLSSVPVHFDWRFAEREPSFVDLLAAVGSVHRVDYSAFIKLDDTMWPRFLGTTVDAMKKLDASLSEAFPRDFVSIPVIVEQGVVMVPIDFARRRMDILETENGRIKALTSSGEKLIHPYWLGKEPLTTIYFARKGEEEFFGLKAKEGAYSSEVGLP